MSVQPNDPASPVNGNHSSVDTNSARHPVSNAIPMTQIAVFCRLHNKSAATSPKTDNASNSAKLSSSRSSIDMECGLHNNSQSKARNRVAVTHLTISVS